MPDFATASQAIEVHFDTNFTEIPAVNGDNVPLHRYENVPWNVDNVELIEWIELYVVHGSGQNASVGNVSPGGGLKTRYFGMVQADIYTPVLKGTRRPLVIAGAFALLYQNQFVAGITFYEASITPSESPNTDYSRMIVKVVFHRDEIT